MHRILHKSDYGLIIFLLLCAGLALLNSESAWHKALENSFYAAYRQSFAQSNTSPVVHVDIDDASLRSLGAWPWSYRQHAKLLQHLNTYSPRLIVSTLHWPLQDAPQDLQAINQLVERYDASSLVNSFFCETAEADDLHQEVSALGASLHQTRDAMDADQQLRRAISQANNVYLPLIFSAKIDNSLPHRPELLNLLRQQVLPYMYFDMAEQFTPPTGGSLQASLGLSAAQGLGAVMPALGFAESQTPLVFAYQEQIYPSLALRTALAAMNLELSAIRMHSNGLWLDGQYLPSDNQWQVRPRHYLQVPRYSAVQILQAEHKPDLSDKIIILGFKASTATVGSEYLSQAEVMDADMLADTLLGLMQGELLVTPDWSWLLQLGTALLALIILWLPRPRQRLPLHIIYGLFLLGLQAVLFIAGLWISLLLPLLLLLLGIFGQQIQALWLKNRQQQHYSQEAIEANRLLGLAYQSQGKLNEAFARFQRCPANDEILGLLYNLAWDFECQRDNRQALKVYRWISDNSPDFRDTEQRVLRLQQQLQNPRLPGTEKTNWLEENFEHKPMLGRYQIERKIGKGAMGVVYLGTDPRMDRVVAIKTLALSEEFEGAALTEATERFFREAAAAGRLDHPHIVRVYDAGEEHNLAYLAMEFFKGGNLMPFTHKENLLPIKQVLEIGIHAAEALAYAHQQGVVHRDIKPANILYNPASGLLKLTDFGIARISDNQRTKTGVILGTPSYMSPEQLDGAYLDGRSDLYSLGVSLYQLLTGELPFQADSLASLMFKIAHESPPEISSLRPDLLPRMQLLMDTLLHKNMAARYSDGFALAQALRHCQTGLLQESSPPSEDMPQDEDS